MRSATMSGRSAPTRSFAASLNASGSACGGAERESFGMLSNSALWMRFSCRSESIVTTTGAIGGVTASL